MILVYYGDHVKMNVPIHIEDSGAFLGTTMPPTASMVINGYEGEPMIRMDNLTRADLERLKAAIEEADEVLNHEAH